MKMSRRNIFRLLAGAVACPVLPAAVAEPVEWRLQHRVRLIDGERVMSYRFADGKGNFRYVSEDEAAREFREHMAKLAKIGRYVATGDRVEFVAW